jgi:hypothetical protein
MSHTRHSGAALALRFAGGLALLLLAGFGALCLVYFVALGSSSAAQWSFDWTVLSVLMYCVVSAALLGIVSGEVVPRFRSQFCVLDLLDMQASAARKLAYVDAMKKLLAGKSAYDALCVLLFTQSKDPGALFVLPAIMLCLDAAALLLFCYKARLFDHLRSDRVLPVQE